VASKWKKYSYWFERHRVEPRPGVYVLLGQGIPLYVGQSTNVYKRLNYGKQKVSYSYTNYLHTPWGYFLDIGIKVRYSVTYGGWAAIELRLIKRLQPCGNKRGK